MSYREVYREGIEDGFPTIFLKCRNHLSYLCSGAPGNFEVSAVFRTVAPSMIFKLYYAFCLFVSFRPTDLERIFIYIACWQAKHRGQLAWTGHVVRLD